MDAAAFLNALSASGWQIDRTPTTLGVGSTGAADRLAEAPRACLDFLGSFTSCVNSDETRWFISAADYGDDDVAFPWDEFERQSLDAATTPEEIAVVRRFWHGHVPFFMSVAYGYSYAAVTVVGDAVGSVVVGREPEYEAAETVARDLPSFFDWFVHSQKDL